MADHVYNVLFLCKGNSARSIMAEMILNSEAHGRFRAYSAGSEPVGSIHPLVQELAQDIDYPLDTLRSKSLDEFARPDAPEMDLIITVCSDQADEPCPVWPGRPASAHWHFPDPLAVEASDPRRRDVFQQVFRQLSERIHFLLMLKDATLDRMALETHARQAVSA
jgi:arsenate reductase